MPGAQTFVDAALGRVTWQTDRGTLATLNSGANAAETVYNSLGQVIATYRMSGVVITLGPDANAGSDASLQETKLFKSGAPVSVTTTIYDGQGQAVETDGPSGLRSGTIYYPGGSVEYAGPLKTAASSTWYLSADPRGSFTSYTTNLYNQPGALSSNPWSGLLYDRTIDANGHHTDTYKDPTGQTSFTVYDDGSLSYCQKSWMTAEA